MKVKCLFDKMVSVDELKAHPKNRNKHPADQIERLAKILKFQGWRYPVKVSKLSGFVTSGHGRIEAARLAGWKQVPVNFQEYDDEAQEYADVQADNAIALWAELDIESIKLDLESIEIDFSLLGLNEKHFTSLADQILKDGSIELNEAEFSKFDHTCPKCGFGFDAKN